MKLRFPNISFFVAICALISLLFYCAYIATALITERALFADGANFFIGMLGRSFDWPSNDDRKHIRLFVNALNQFPLALAIKMQITSLPALKFLFAAGLFITPLLAYVFCFLLSRRASDFRPFFLALFSYVTCCLPSEIFILNQALTAVALSWIVLHYILLDLKVGRGDILLLVVIATILFRAHEGIMFWGAVIAFAAGAKIFLYRRKQKPFSWTIPALGFLGLAQAVFTFYWQFSRPIEQRTQDFLAIFNSIGLHDVLHGGLRIPTLAAVMGLFIFLWIQIKKYVSQSRQTMIYFLGFTGLLLIFGIVLIDVVKGFSDPSLLQPNQEFSYRVLIPFMTPIWMILAIVLVFARVQFAKIEYHFIVLAISLAVSLSSLRQMYNNYHWNEFRKAVIFVLENSQDLVVSPQEVFSYNASKNQSYLNSFGWPWTWSTLGLSLQQTPEVVRLYKPERPDYPFHLPENGDGRIWIPFVFFKNGGLFQFHRFSELCLDTNCAAGNNNSIKF